MAQDPKIQTLVQQSPMKPQIEAALMAHVQEHLGMQYRVQIEQQLGMALPPQYDASGEANYMDPEVEARLAPLLAQAATQLLQMNQAQAAQQQAQQQAQDPLVQMQQQELQIKAAEQQRKQQKDVVDAQLKQEQMQIERQRITTQAQTEMAKTAVQVQQDSERTKVELLRQEKELHAKGVDNAFKHAHAAAQLKQPKKEKPTKGD
jgi:hypothetical protein